MVKTPWYANVQVSMEYTDAEGTRRFKNLTSGISNGDWIEISDNA